MRARALAVLASTLAAAVLVAGCVLKRSSVARTYIPGAERHRHRPPPVACRRMVVEY